MAGLMDRLNDRLRPPGGTYYPSVLKTPVLEREDVELSTIVKPGATQITHTPGETILFNREWPGGWQLEVGHLTVEQHLETARMVAEAFAARGVPAREMSLEEIADALGVHIYKEESE